MSVKTTFEKAELLLMSDADILLTKKKIQEKVWQLLSSTQQKIKQEITSSYPDFPFARFNPGRISKGENYKNLPYMILDYPSKFSMEDILAFRTMFYWGNFYSATLHLQGSYLERNRTSLANNIDTIEKLNCYISTNTSPWHYHYEVDNYTRLNGEHNEKFLNDEFIKLSLKIELENYTHLPEKVAEFYLILLRLISIDSI